MATPNVGILTTTGKALIDKVNSGQAKISFSKVVFSSMDNSQLSDTQIKALTAIAPQEVVVSSPQTTLDTNSGETRIRATGTNEKLADGVYVKTYGVFAKDDTGNEILYGVTVSPNPNYFPAYDGVTPQAVTYSYKTVIQETSNIIMTNSNDVYVSQEDLTEAIAKIPQPDLSGYDKTDDVDKKLQNKQDKLGFTAANDSAVVHTADMRKPANDVAGIEEVNAKQNLIGYTPADDSKVVHNSGNEEIGGQKTFDVAPIDKTTGNPYITRDGVPSIPSDVARTSQQTNFTAGLQSGGVDVATAADLKSVEASAWRPLTLKNSTSGIILFKDNGNGTASLTGTATFTVARGMKTPAITPPTGYTFTSVNWNQDSNIGYNNGAWANRDMGDGSGGVLDTFDTTISKGNICFLGKSDITHAVTFSPSELTTLSDSTECNPALVSISKV